MNLNEKEVYFRVLCNNNYPQFIDKYIQTKEMQKL